ncbi:hybrid sensor histidine kinase/response regulator [Halosimplex salinum]|uniref:hybrid sensor histidine kinase/response regulator n=1 Tax=Halosimplex salinum TaxID=1710538 RepID=UPI000F4627BC|nr:ATP-binding protein [Halosimplex salinum]
MSGTERAIRVLHVDDDPDLGDLVAAALEREDSRFEVTTATSPADGLDVLDDDRIDCVVSDYDMPGTNGIGFLEAVRADYPDLPFILYTGKGSEEVASEAVSAGVTDYLQKGTGTDQYALLANRVGNAVAAARSQRALEERNRRLETLISNLPGIVYRCRNEPGWPLEFVAGECASITGYTTDELTDGAVDWGEDVLHPDDREQMWERVQSALDAGESFEVSYRIRTADGGIRWMWERGQGIGDETADRIEGFIADVTDRKEREQTLERYRSMVDAMPDSACIYDAEGRFAVVNDYLVDFLDTTAEELVGEPSTLVEKIRTAAGAGEDPFQALVDGDREELRGEVDGQFPSRGYAAVDYRLARLEIDGEFDGVVAVARDITERKRREDALSALTEATRRFMTAPDRETVAEHAVETARAVLGHDINGVWLIDADGSALRPVAWTDDADALFDEVPTYTGGESLAWRTYESGDLTVSESLQNEADRYNPETPIESEVVLPLGEYGVMIVGATDPASFGDADVSLARILANTVEAALDRADREQASRRHRRELERQNERLDEFAAIVSHDLRNPLQVATARLGFARAECDSDHLDAVERAHDRMEALIEDLLTLGREGKTVLEIEPVPLASVAESCWESVATPGARLVVDADADTTVRADRRRLQQLLENLVGNSVEHGTTGLASQPPDESAVTVTVGTLAGGTGIFVADDGPGIDPEERERVFSSGYSTSADGTGFGLSIVEQIADAHGWSVDVTESVEGGARFEVTGVDVDD